MASSPWQKPSVKHLSHSWPIFLIPTLSQLWYPVDPISKCASHLVPSDQSHHHLGPVQALKISLLVYRNDFPNWSFTSLPIHHCQIYVLKLHSLSSPPQLKTKSCTISSLPEKYSPNISGPSRSAANLCSGFASHKMLLLHATLQIIWTSQNALIMLPLRCLRAVSPSIENVFFSLPHVSCDLLRLPQHDCHWSYG